MRKVYVVRAPYLADGAFGMMLDDFGVPFAVTVEKTFENLLPKLDDGNYECPKSRYHKGGYDTFEILKEGHTRLLFHVANDEGDLDGCIGVAEKFESVNGKLSVLESKKGFQEFWERYKGEDRIMLVLQTVKLA